MDPQNPDRQVHGLLSLSHDRSRSARETVLTVAQDLFNGRDRVLTQSDRILMHNLARSLVDRVEASVRGDLANYLGSLPDAPHATVAYLSGISRSIAYSILVDSGVLGDLELVEALYHKALQQQLTMARGRSSPEEIGRVIDAALEPEVETAAAAPSGARYFFRPLDAPEPPSIEPAELSSNLVRRLCLWCSVALRQHLLENQRVDEIVLDDALEYAVDEAARRLGGRADAPAPDAAPVTPAPEPDTPDSLVSLLEDGKFAEFESALSRISKLRPALVRRLIYEPGGEGLATICVATDVPRRAFAAIYLMTREPEAAGVQQVAKALSFFDRLNPVAARRVASRWRRDAEYLNALREVGGA